MTRKLVPLVVLLIVAITLVGVVVAAQGSNCRDTALHFLNDLAPCVYSHGDLQIVQNPCFAGPGCYCMYYQDDPAWAPGGSHHGFGWYPCKTKCSALYQLVEEPTRNCCFNQVINSAPHQIMPPASGIVFQIPPEFAPAGFYLNTPEGRTFTQGLYYTDLTRNRDGISHVCIFRVEYKPKDCSCPCDRNGKTRPIDNVMYVMVWEDWCGGGDSDWDDFVVALIPVTCPCQ